MVEFFSVTVFSDLPSGGSLVSVVLDASRLDVEEMQFIAGKTRHSETAFVFPSAVAGYKIRFFNGAGEIDFSGNASVAVFALLAKLKLIDAERSTQESTLGILNVEIARSGQVFISLATPSYGDYVEQSEIAQSLNLDIGKLHPIFLPQIVSTGNRYIFIPLKDLKALNELKPNFSKIAKMSLQRSVFGYHVFCLDTLFGGFAHCRNFAPLYDAPEESATATASGALACYLYGQGLLADNTVGNIVFEQGFSMGQLSQVTTRLTTVDGVITGVQVGGNICLTEGPVKVEHRAAANN